MGQEPKINTDVEHLNLLIRLGQCNFKCSIGENLFDAFFPTELKKKLNQNFWTQNNSFISYENILQSNGVPQIYT